jgi:hypothetical protein
MTLPTRGQTAKNTIKIFSKQSANTKTIPEKIQHKNRIFVIIIQNRLNSQ